MDEIDLNERMTVGLAYKIMGYWYTGKSHYQVEIREYHDEDIIEINTFKELKAIDKTYDV